MGQPEEAAASPTQHDGHDPPPSYNEAVGEAPPQPPRLEKNNPFRPVSSSFTEPDGFSSATQTAQLVRLPRRFPTQFGMYYEKAIGVPTFNLGAEQDQPLYSVTFQIGTPTQVAHIILHSSTDPASAPLALIERTDRPGHRTQIQLAGPDSAPTKEQLVASSSFGSSFTFSIGVGRQPHHPRVESFEWRHSKGGEVRSLGGQVGHKLVRLSTEADGVGGTRAVRDEGASSDGREVVAAWADNPRWAGNRAGSFRFLGSGASGELGDRFELMAVASCLRIWEWHNGSSLHKVATGAGLS